MAVNEIEVAAPPETVWGVLADPEAYAYWVVGTKEIRGADDGFPAEGTWLYQKVGAGPLTLSDSSKVLRADPPRLLLLEARLGPLGSARVEIELRAPGAGTVVGLKETGARGPNRLLQPVGDLLLRGRNKWSLDRLKELAEQRA